MPEQMIEGALNEKLRGDALKCALDFIAYLRAGGFTNDDEYNCNFYYSGEPTCVILCHEHKDYPSGLWGIYNYPVSEYADFPLDEGLKEFARANVRICSGECGCPNWPRGGDQTVYGKEFKSVCSSVICFFNPDADDLIKIKKMFDNWKLIIASRHSCQV